MGSSMDERKGEKVTSDLPWFGNSAYVHLFMRAWRHLYRLHGKEREREGNNDHWAYLIELGPNVQWVGSLSPSKIYSLHSSFPLLIFFFLG